MNSKKNIKKSNSLSQCYPSLAREWNYEKNENLCSKKVLCSEKECLLCKYLEMHRK